MKLEPMATHESGWLAKPEYIKGVLYEMMNNKTDTDDTLRELESYNRRIIKLLDNIGIDIIWNGGIFRYGPYEYMLFITDGHNKLGWREYIDGQFYLYSIINEKPRIVKSFYLEEIDKIRKYTNKTIKIPIIGPYTFVKMSYIKYYINRWRNIEKEDFIIKYKAIEDAIHEVSEDIIRKLIKDIIEYDNNTLIQVDEFIGIKTQEDKDFIKTGIDTYLDQHEDNLIIQIGYTDIETQIELIEETGIKNIMINMAKKLYGHDRDKVERTLKLLKDACSDINISIGIIDLSERKVEDTQKIIDNVNTIIKYLEPSRLRFTPDYPYQHTKLRNEIRKIENMVRAIKLVREEIST
jgi:methionine synthase II (cobalamin-independent)